MWWGSRGRGVSERGGALSLWGNRYHDKKPFKGCHIECIVKGRFGPHPSGMEKKNIGSIGPVMSSATAGFRGLSLGEAIRVRQSGGIPGGFPSRRER